MFELIINTPVSFVVSGPSGTPLTDHVLYKDGTASGLSLTVSQIGATNAWKVTFTPNTTGMYSLYAFGTIQFNAQCSAKSLYAYLLNIEDEALGSWTWNKNTGVLTILRQTGATLATHDVVDNLTTASRERVS